MDVVAAIRRFGSRSSSVRTHGNLRRHEDRNHIGTGREHVGALDLHVRVLGQRELDRVQLPGRVEQNDAVHAA